MFKLQINNNNCLSVKLIFGNPFYRDASDFPYNILDQV